MTIGDRCELLAGAFGPRDVAAGRASWCTDGLIATPAARARVLRWAAEGGPIADPSVLRVLGPENDVEAVVRRALERMPPPVVEHAARHIIIAVVGRDAAGWVGHLPPMPAAVEAVQLVVLDVDDDEPELQATLAHELAHAWLTQPVLPPGPRERPAPNPCRDQDGRTDAAALDAVLPARSVDRARDELRVATLAAAWGFVGRAADVDRFAADLRRAQHEQNGRSDRAIQSER